MNLFIYLFLRLLASNVSVRYILKVVIFYRVFYRTVLTMHVISRARGISFLTNPCMLLFHCIEHSNTAEIFILGPIGSVLLYCPLKPKLSFYNH